KPLWPARYSAERLETIRQEMVHNPGAYNRTYLSDSHDESTARCKQEFIDSCLKRAREVGAYGVPGSRCEDFLPYYGRRPDGTVGPGENFFTITGIDLAFRVEEQHDLSCMFTYECNRPDGLYRVVDVDYGHWDALTVANKAIDKALRYNSVLAVEAVGGQSFMIDMIRDKLTRPVQNAHGQSVGYELLKHVQVYPMMTSQAAKANPSYGVESLFYEMARGSWLFPNKAGVVRREMAQFIRDCREYEPSRHVSDLLMACFLARWKATDWAMLGRPMPQSAGGGVGSVLMR
ncbi:MAG TPA: hypothetical protein VN864_01670, partial [Thermoplasmata archaeon]|nr:hypothetical protein [Thermoplasmata archaeon]